MAAIDYIYRVIFKQDDRSGLGMAVSRDIIRAHGGDITLINTVPKGLTVIVTLPK